MPKRFLFVLATFGLSVLLYVDRVCISVAKESVAGDLSLNEKQMGWIFSAFTLGYALCQTPGGYLADRLGPRRVLAMIVALWSLFTGLTAAAFGFISLFVVRFLFGAGEAGAFPGIARAVYSWIPMRERGLVQGINFSGSRLGAAFALPLVALLIDGVEGPQGLSGIGWRPTFVLLMMVGLVWAACWYRWFRDDPAELGSISESELQLIRTNRQDGSADNAGGDRGIATTVSRGNLGLLCGQYFASNFTFFYCLSWMFPTLKQTYQLSGLQAGLYASVPLLCGALGNWFSGWLIDAIYARGHWVASRRVPAIIGFTLAVFGLAGSLVAETALSSSIWFSLAIFGADMTLSPSWSTCIDVGRERAGVISGTMNMAGNIGAFLTSLAFPYFAAWTLTAMPGLSNENIPFFVVAAALNVAAVAMWLAINPAENSGPTEADA
jgi:ACS family glucarate transporter-like MFS transporter